MAGEIHNIGQSYGGYGNFYSRQEKAEQHVEEQVQLPVENREEKLVDADEVMRFMENNNLTITPKTTTEPVKLSADVENRVFEAMERFQEIYPVVVQEFGDFLAPRVMNIIMDKLMAIV